jgi:hypothetical protein
MLVAWSESPVIRCVCVRPSPLREIKTVRGFFPVERVPVTETLCPSLWFKAPFQLGVGPLGLLRSASVGVQLCRVPCRGARFELVSA